MNLSSDITYFNPFMISVSIIALTIILFLIHLLFTWLFRDKSINKMPTTLDVPPISNRNSMHPPGNNYPINYENKELNNEI